MKTLIILIIIFATLFATPLRGVDPPLAEEDLACA